MSSSGARTLRFMDRFVDPVLLMLAVASIPLVIIETGPTSAADESALLRLNWIIWALFTINFIIRVAVAPDRRAEARYLAWDLLIIVAQPVLAAVGAGATGGAPLVRLIVVLARAAGRGAMVRRGWDAARRSPLKLALGFTPVLWLTASAIVYRIEIASDGSVDTLGDALWWGAATLTTVGYGDVSPSSTWARGVAIVTMLGGISLFSVVTASLADSFVASRLGRSARSVRSEGHVVILGSSRKFDTLVRGLCDSAAARGELASIVTMSPSSTTEHSPHTVSELTRRGHFIDVRSGDTSDPAQLRTLSVADARAVLLISDSPDDDSATVRTLLALGQLSLTSESSVPAIAELHEHGRVREMRSVAGSLVTILDTPQFLSRAAARACRAPGALTAYRTLLAPDGPSLQRLPPGTPRTPDTQRTPETPDERGTPDTQGASHAAPVVAVRRGGEILVGRSIPEDLSSLDEQVVLAASPNPRDGSRAPGPDAAAELRQPLRLLLDEIPPVTSEQDAVIVGWNDLAPGLALMLAATLTGKAEVRIVIDLRHPDIDAARRWAEDHPRCSVIGWDRANGVVTSNEMVGSCSRAVILSDTHRSPDASDATGLLAMLQLRDRSDENDTLLGVICELADPTSAALVRPGPAEELLVREELVSMLLTQFASDPQLHPVMEALLLSDALQWEQGGG